MWIIPSQHINFALEVFYIAVNLKNLYGKVQTIRNLQAAFAAPSGTAAIAMGVSTFPILLITAFEVILIRARKTVVGVEQPSDQSLPLFRGCRADLTTILQTAALATRLLAMFDELVGSSRKKIKSQSRLSGEESDIATQSGGVQLEKSP